MQRISETNPHDHHQSSNEPTIHKHGAKLHGHDDDVDEGTPRHHARSEDASPHDQVSVHVHGTIGGGSATTSPSISELHAVVSEAYGGGLYGTDDVPTVKPSNRTMVHASDALSAEGPPTTTPTRVHPPPSTGDRDLDITGQSYIQ